MNSIQNTAFYKKLEEKLHEKSTLNDIFSLAESRTGFKRVYLALGMIVILVIYLVFGYGAGLICNLIGFLYPAYLSMHALETSSKEDDTKWLTYWVVFASFSIVEFFSDIILNWVPFYWLGKCVFLIWCSSPSTNGATTVYTRLIRPVFLKNKDVIDKHIGKLKETIGEAASKVTSEAKLE